MSEETMRMNCTQFEEILNDLDRPGMPEGALRESALAHAESCGPCARLLTETESLDFALQALGEQESERHAPAHVEAALLQAFRHEKQAAMRPRIWWQLSALAAAAAVLLTLGISLRQHWVPGLNPDGITAVVTPLAAKPAAVSSDTSASEYASGFVALPYADDAANVEGASVVRVALSRSALASLGVPVADATDTNEVPADLIVSMDGTPQAIRLVSEVTAN
jgi:hypothetical protein